ncbi:MAG: hypothetical protein H7Z42_10305 [Roseiflexaceae bacterium]|nr:hypothetical protein [Roseiflexaceae bacterium]
MASTTSGSGLDAVEYQPSGGSTGVSFDWGFAVSLTLGALGSLVGRPIGPELSLPVALGSLVLAAVGLALGEALRRGNGVARRIQIGFHSLLVLVGIPILLPTVQAFQQGRSDLLYTLVLSIILFFVVSPSEIWLLMRPGSRRWYGIVDPKEALERHSGGWLVRTITWAVVGGFLNAFAPF